MAAILNNYAPFSVKDIITDQATRTMFNTAPTRSNPIKNDDDLVAFLSESKNKFLAVLSGADTSTSLADWVLVTGNEAGDLDSMASAITLAYLCTKSEQGLSTKDGRLMKNFVPLLQIHRKDLNMRPENIMAMQKAYLSPEQNNGQTPVMLLDDIEPYMPLHDSLSWALVDHGLLNAHLSATRAPKVIAIFDHHEDFQKHTDYTNIRSIFVPTGSCVSIVMTHPEFQSIVHRIPSSLAQLALSALLIDTNNMKESKATPRDREAFEILFPLSMLSSLEAMTDLHRNLSDAKTNLQHLGIDELIRRDFKQYATPLQGNDSNIVNWGLSSSPIAISQWVDKARNKADSTSDVDAWDELWRQLEAFADDKSNPLDIFAVMCSFNNPRHRRELVILIRNPQLDFVIDSLEDNVTINLSEWPGGVDWLGKQDPSGPPAIKYVWEQHNVHATRKIVAPVIEHILKQ